MTKTFTLTIAGVGQTLFAGEATSVTLPGSEGVFTVLAGHEAFVTPLKEGSATVRTADNEEIILTIPAGGVAEVSNGQATVLL